MGSDGNGVSNMNGDFDQLLKDRNVVELGTGEYGTDGVNAEGGWFRLRDGLSIRGAGMFQTIVKLRSILVPDAKSNKPMNCVFHSGWRSANNTLIENLTIDCNAQAFDEHPEKLLGGISLFGNNNVVRNVRVINSCATRPGGSGMPGSFEEGFPLMLGAFDVSTSGLLIDGCIVDGTFPRGYQSLISILGGHGVSASGEIRNCRAIGTPTANVFGFNFAKTRGSRMRGNYAEKCVRGINLDTPDNESPVIDSNDCKDAAVGALIYFMSNGLVRDNVFSQCVEPVRLGVSDASNLFANNVVANTKKRAFIRPHDGKRKNFRELGTVYQTLA